jgi:oxaloacetate decarboxylase (Na+ extruding) subunit alpha
MMAGDTIRIIDTTLRDGQQSLWACCMRPSAMLPAAPDIDDAGFEAAEFTSPAIFFRRSVLDLKEHPWDWLALGSARFKKTPLRLHGGAGSRFLDIPPVVQRLFLDKLVELGITTTRTSDPWNNYDDFRPIQDGLAAQGIKTVVNLIYSVSPRHTL